MSRRPILRALAAFSLLVLAAALAGCLDTTRREAATTTLARWEDRRLADPDSLARLLTDDDAHVRRAALRTAGRIGRTDVLTEVIAGLGDPSPAVRAAAAEALGFLGDPAGAAPLTAAFADNGPAVRRAVLFALARIPNDGLLLRETALRGETTEAVLAWNALRDRAAELDTDVLAATIRGGLVRDEIEVLWRVLRCAERTDDPDLAELCAAFTTHENAQVRVHACRALAARGGDAAYPGLLDCGADPGRFNARDHARIDIALLRSLGRRGGAALDDEDADPQPLIALLTAGSRHADPHVARTALEAMTELVAERPLPEPAARRESLLPVWRIRLLQSARAQLESTEPVVRAAAVGACIALRGPGVVDTEDWTVIRTDEHALVRAAVWQGLGAHVLDAAGTIAWCRTIDGSMPPALHMSALEGLVAARTRLIEILPDSLNAPLDEAVERMLRRSVGETDPDVAALASGLLGGFPSAANLEALQTAWTDARDLPGVDIRRGVLQALTIWADRDDFVVPDSLVAPTIALLEEGFDSPQAHIRAESRTAAVALGLPAAELVPSAASLAATLPAHVRDPRQPAVRLPFAAPRVRCETERGVFVLELDGQRAPNTCAAFLSLIEAGFYTDLEFHRVVPDFVIQGGCPRNTGWGGPGWSIRSEWTDAPYVRGTLGIAHSGKDTGGSQFFVALSPQPHLNGRYTVFGRVAEGIEVAERVQPGDPFVLSIEAR